jgi:hypothetical protein
MAHYFKILLLSVFLASSYFAKASHIATGFLTYEHISGFSYQVNLTVYRDCSGVAIPSTAVVHFNCDLIPSNYFSQTLNLVAGSGQEITSACLSMGTTCTGGTAFGMQEYVYSGVVTLPPTCSWTMYTVLGSRAPASSLSTGNDMIVRSTLNNDSISPAFNSSAVLQEMYPTLLNVFDTINIDPNAIDPDGDSLVFSFYHPYGSIGGPGSSAIVNYMFPYSFSNFIASSTAISLDSNSGVLSLSPNLLMSTVMGIVVDEWRTSNGMPFKVGSTQYDLHLRAINNTNMHRPQLLGIDTSLSPQANLNDTLSQIYTYALDTLSFIIHGYDLDSFNLLASLDPASFSIAWNSLPQGASMVLHNDHTDSAFVKFTWVPSLSDTSSMPYILDLSIADDGCPYTLSSNKKYKIWVQQNTTSINPSWGDGAIKVYPNPVSDYLYVDLPLETKHELEVYSLDGKRVLSVDVQYEKQRIDLSKIPSGIYLLRSAQAPELMMKIIKI